MINLLDNTSNQPKRSTKIRRINYDSRETYNTNSQIKFKNLMLESSLCDYSDTYILVKGTISNANTAAQDANINNSNKKVIIKNCASFNDFISEVNNTQVDNNQDIDAVMLMNNVIEYINNYSKTFGSLLQYYRNKSSLNNNDNIVDFTGANHNSNLFKCKNNNESSECKEREKSFKK